MKGSDLTTVKSVGLLSKTTSEWPQGWEAVWDRDVTTEGSPAGEQLCAAIPAAARAKMWLPGGNEQVWLGLPAQSVFQKEEKGAALSCLL